MHSHRRVAAISAGLFLAGLTLTACTQPPTAEVGDCLDAASVAEEVSEIPTVSCEDPHDAEVYHKFDMPDGDYPGDDALFTAAEEGCVDAFEPYVGMDYAESEIWITYLTPLEASWSTANDREVICILETDDPVTGSLKNSRR